MSLLSLELSFIIQSTDGRVLQASLEIGIRPKPVMNKRKRKQAIRPRITFCAPESEDKEALAQLIGEDTGCSFGALLEKYKNELEVSEIECAYWGVPSEREGISYLIIEINVAHPRVKSFSKHAKRLKNVLKQKKGLFAMLF